jgi:peptidoglycan/LPS O-acetylase OafA/YrhL
VSLKATEEPSLGDRAKVSLGYWGYRPVGFRSDIQGLRAVAVLLVVLYHANLPGLSGGYIGVDVFFVISGFLITAHLLGTFARKGRIDFGDFYARRIRRILPASLVVLLLSVAASLIFVPPLLLPPIMRDALLTGLYVPNFAFANRSIDYLSDPNPSIFQHYWSLGVEEQFYLLWPAILVVAFLLFRKSRRGLLIALVVTFLISLALSLFLTSRSQPWAFFMMPTRAWEFAIGGLVAYLMTSTHFELKPRWGAVVGWSGLVGVIACAIGYDDATVFPGTAAIFPVFASALVILGGSTTPAARTAGALLSIRPMVSIGALSYSIYLVHWPILMIPQIVSSDQRDLPLAATLGLALVSVPLAWLLYRFVEEPARSWSWLATRRPRRTLWLSLAVAVLVVSLCVSAVRMVATWPLESNQSASPLARSAPLDATTFVPANLRPGLREASSDNPDIYANKCHLSETETDATGCSIGMTEAPLTVALFGDSHAAQWYPAFAAMADRGEILLSTHTKSSCPSAMIPPDVLAVPYPECGTWRTGVLERLTSDPPDIVVLSNFAASVGTPGDATFPEMWERSMQATVSMLSKRSQVIIVGDTPHFEIAPPTCLSAHIEDATACAGAPEESLWPEIAQAERDAASGGGGLYLDPIRFLCDEVQCPVVLGDVLVYRDSHHMTATFSASLSESLRPLIQGAAR